MAKKEEMQPETFPPEVLPLNLALSYAGTMKNAYRAFQKIEEVLLSVVHAEQHVAESEQRRTKIEKEIAEFSEIFAAKQKESAQQQQSIEDALAHVNVAIEDALAHVNVAQEEQKTCEHGLAVLQQQRAQEEQEIQRLRNQAQSDYEEQTRQLRVQGEEQLSLFAKREAEMSAAVRQMEEEELALKQRNEAAKERIRYLQEEEAQLIQRIEVLRSSLETFRAQTAQLSSL